MGVPGSPGEAETAEETDRGQEAGHISPASSAGAGWAGSEHSWEGRRSGMPLERSGHPGPQTWGSESALDALPRREARLSVPGSGSSADVGGVPSGSGERDYPERPASARKRFHSPRMSNDNPSEYPRVPPLLTKIIR